MILYKLIQVFITIFDKLLYNEEWIILMWTNKQFHNLIINDEFVKNKLTDFKIKNLYSLEQLNCAIMRGYKITIMTPLCVSSLELLKFVIEQLRDEIENVDVKKYNILSNKICKFSNLNHDIFNIHDGIYDDDYKKILYAYVTKKGNIEMIKFLDSDVTSNVNNLCGTLTFVYAIISGNMEVVKYLRNRPKKIYEYEGPINIKCDGMYYDDTDHIKFYGNVLTRDHLYPLDVSICNYAAMSGNIEMLKYFISDEYKCPYNNKICKYAVRSGNMEMIEYIRSMTDKNTWDSDTCTEAVKSGNIEMVKYLRSGLYEKDICPWNSNTFIEAVKSGNIEMVKYLRSELNKEDKCPWNHRVCSEAVKSGNIEMIKYLRSGANEEDKCPYYKNDMYIYAALSGNVEMMKYVRLELDEENKCPANIYICACAAKSGNIEMIKYLRSGLTEEDRFPWDEKTCANAALSGNIEMIKYLRREEDKCPWDTYTCANAALSGNIEMVKYLIQEDKHLLDYKTFVNAAENRDAKMIEYLEENENLLDYRWRSDDECDYVYHVINRNFYGDYESW